MHIQIYIFASSALRDLYETMDKTSSSLPPIILLQFLHMAFPQFAEKGDQGQYLQQVSNSSPQLLSLKCIQQCHVSCTCILIINFDEVSVCHFFLSSQDANECWLQMMRVLQQKLEPLEPETSMEVNSFVFSLPCVVFMMNGWISYLCN